VHTASRSAGEEGKKGKKASKFGGYASKREISAGRAEAEQDGE
jgi:hypothetical protein